MLRLILMSMIVLWHLIVHGIGLAHPEVYMSQGQDIAIPAIIGTLLCYHVNCFIFISGYFQIKLTRKKFLSMIIQLCFYSLFTYLLSQFLYYGADFIHHIHRNFWKWQFPFADGGWWFMADYLVLMLFAPLLNSGTEQIRRSTFEYLLLGLLVFSVSGCKYFSQDTTDKSFLFITMYLLGRYFGKYRDTFIERHNCLFYCISITGLLLFQSYSFYMVGLDSSSFLYATSYGNPFNILAAISFFFIFKKLRLGVVPIVNFLASGCIASYLLTDGFMQSMFNTKICLTVNNDIVLLLLVSIICVVLCSIFEIYRNRFCRSFVEKIDDYINLLLKHEK